MTVEAGSVPPDARSADSDPRFERVPCYACGSREEKELVWAEDDLTGRPGRFRFATCRNCGLAFQNPRLRAEHILSWYGDDYIAHRNRATWGVLQPLFDYAVGGIDRRKDRLVRRVLPLQAHHRLLDVGCGSGSFLHRVQRRYGATTVGLDFKDLSAQPALESSRFVHGLFHEQDFGAERFDLITMWHFLEHDYDPLASLDAARRWLAPEGVLLIEVPSYESLTRRLFGDRWPGLQAPQHTVLFTARSLADFVRRSGFTVERHLPYGGFPAYFYLFTGVAFRIRRGRGLQLRRLLVPYLLGQLFLSPFLLFERRANLAMQTVICRKTR